MYEGTWTISPCPHGEAGALAEALGVSETTARVLVRRGLRRPRRRRRRSSRASCRATTRSCSATCAARARRSAAAIAAGKRICVHGDYDADGICATALAVLILRELGADVDWHLPSRFEEGYGLAARDPRAARRRGLRARPHRRLRRHRGRGGRRGARARARRRRHRPPPARRDAAGLPGRRARARRDYPFPELCGTGVVYKLGEALLGPDRELLARHLDLVALATIADVVPLVDENRALALAGLRALARTQKPGLRALMRAARVDPAAVDEGAVGFRLAPRINASGRLEPARRRARSPAHRGRRRGRAAGARARGAEPRAAGRRGPDPARGASPRSTRGPRRSRRRRGYVLADEGWHEGVIGIVASRLVERFHRPGRADRGRGRATGRAPAARPAPSTCTAASRACSGHLERFGGHRAAAGLSIRPENVDAFADAFAAHADAELTEDDLRSVTKVDAVVSGSELTLDLCSELRQLAPFGLGNPGVTLLLPSCELGELAPVGEGKHLRFRVRERGRRRGQRDRVRPRGLSSTATGGRAATTSSSACEENHWNGTVAPQLVVRRVLDAPEGYEEPARVARRPVAPGRGRPVTRSGRDLRRAGTGRRDGREATAAGIGGVSRAFAGPGVGARGLGRFRGPEAARADRGAHRRECAWRPLAGGPQQWS